MRIECRYAHLTVSIKSSMTFNEGFLHSSEIFKCHFPHSTSLVLGTGDSIVNLSNFNRSTNLPICKNEGMCFGAPFANGNLRLIYLRRTID